MDQTRPLFVYFRSFQTIYRIKTVDFSGKSNSDLWSRRRVRWPLEPHRHHHCPSKIFYHFHFDDLLLGRLQPFDRDAPHQILKTFEIHFHFFLQSLIFFRNIKVQTDFLFSNWNEVNWNVVFEHVLTSALSRPFKIFATKNRSERRCYVAKWVSIMICSSQVATRVMFFRCICSKVSNSAKLNVNSFNKETTKMLENNTKNSSNKQI